MAISKSALLQEKGKKLIPGLTQLLSKRPDQFAPGIWPCYYSKAKGTEVWDLDGNCYIDMSISGIGANILGYCDSDVDAAVHNAISHGNSCSLNCPEEIELAELLCEIHPWAEMVRYGRGGGEVMVISIRIARAYTGKDKVAFCGYHGWHDWYLAANLGKGNELEGHLLPDLKPNGVPKGLMGTALPFRYNHPEDLQTIVNENPEELAAIVMEPIRNIQPQSGFLESVRNIADEIGAVLIFDEVTSAFRMNSGGAHLLFKVIPDIAVFAKSISNGYPMGAVIGKKSVMTAVEDTFISSTYWSERIGPVAALATIRKHQQENVGTHLMQIGTKIQQGWNEAAKQTGLNILVEGIPPMSHFSFQYPEALAMMTLFVQSLLERGFLASNRFYANFAHKEEHVDSYLKAVKETFDLIAEAQRHQRVAACLKGSVAKPGFHRWT